MTPYLVVAGLLWILAILELQGPAGARLPWTSGRPPFPGGLKAERSLPELVPVSSGANSQILVRWSILFLFIGFAGLRFETGYDWLAYEGFFYYLPNLNQLLTNPDHMWALITQDWPEESCVYTEQEALYALFNIVVKSVGGGFQLLLFLTAVFNGVVLYAFVKKHGGRPAFSFALYFCFLYLSTQMIVIRQSIASSFVLLSITCYLDRKKVKAALLLIMAAGFHTSVVLFSPLFFLGKIKPRPTLAIATVASGYAFLLSGGGLMEWAHAIISPFAPALIQYKLDIYLTLRFYPSLASFAYAVCNTIILWICYRQGENTNWTPQACLFFYISLLLLVSQLVFSHLPLVWNRIQCVSFVTNTCVLSKLFSEARIDILTRTISAGALAVASMFVLSYHLSRPDAELFIPYNSYIEYVITGDPGDGRQRLYKASMEYYSDQLEER